MAIYESAFIKKLREFKAKLHEAGATPEEIKRAASVPFGARRINTDKRLSRLRARRAMLTKDNQVIAKMTNWQRNQWARAGYPRGNGILEEFAALSREEVRKAS